MEEPEQRPRSILLGGLVGMGELPRGRFGVFNAWPAVTASDACRLSQNYFKIFWLLGMVLE